MVRPSEPVTLNPDEIEELNQKLSSMRHDINNYLTLVVAAVELTRQNPSNATRMLSALADQPGRISDAVKKFSLEFERAMGIKRK
jgi:hypothetical protein